MKATDDKVAAAARIRNQIHNTQFPRVLRESTDGDAPKQRSTTRANPYQKNGVASANAAKKVQSGEFMLGVRNSISRSMTTKGKFTTTIASYAGAGSVSVALQKIGLFSQKVFVWAAPICHIPISSTNCTIGSVTRKVTRSMAPTDGFSYKDTNAPLLCQVVRRP